MKNLNWRIKPSSYVGRDVSKISNVLQSFTSRYLSASVTQRQNVLKRRGAGCWQTNANVKRQEHAWLTLCEVDSFVLLAQNPTWTDATSTQTGVYRFTCCRTQLTKRNVRTIYRAIVKPHLCIANELGKMYGCS